MKTHQDWAIHIAAFLTDTELDEFAFALNGDTSEKFFQARSEINQKRNPGAYTAPTHAWIGEALPDVAEIIEEKSC